MLELGPGKGTLMRDILRVFSQQKEYIKIKIHLLEFSKVLKSYQKENLKQYCHDNIVLNFPFDRILKLY